MNIFLNIQGLDLTPGNKSAGFQFSVSTETLSALSLLMVQDRDRARLNQEVSLRLERSGLLKTAAARSASVFLLESSACPRVFTTDPSFGASLSADPQALLRLPGGDARERLGDVVDYTPHNCDAPAQALALLVMVHTWAEWAEECAMLYRRASN